MGTPDFNDIVFEHHNRVYGAYILRKKYSRVLVVSTVAGCMLFSLIVFLSFFRSPKKGSDLQRTVEYVVMENFAPPAEDVLLNPPPPPPPPKGKQMAEFIQKTMKFVPPEVVDSISPKQMSTEETGSSKDSTENKGSVSGDYGVSSGTGSGPGVPGGTGTGDWYLKAEVMPVFKGGDIEKFREWVMKRTRYPRYAMTNNIQGKVYISFIVELDGRVSTVMVVKGVDPSIDTEAKKVVESSPDWEPGKTAGKAVRVKYIIGIDFQL